MDGGIGPVTWGWLGAGLLVLAGYGWGRQVSSHGVTGAWLAAMLALTLAGLYLVGSAALAGHDLPVTVGLVGAVAASLLSVYTPD
ncbi:MATE efflux family protein [Deinococcus proteolyticus MRP]|uniref:MATE efflux family protein n=1 Tax=Deinococcus proteolyticus (strain ATCC 35074 / DSM 20540 / JCM 6276 / NBRC 101906 / NCIMB 13154 / VKM Ac-1939 / CCM 2703 / MRP) TaxID=693977 RepID=F0RM13_DEIPM|nr:MULTISPECIES: hypothetical protein [Deinococcus]ADY27023.1 MATE efflux family protein [Deinococcus proteolyticus MRP]MCY1703147.1 hypothetical protein [Deinococcus sp. SL84]